jgi:glycosyltransferase involved in cell wall biosynthesis
MSSEWHLITGEFPPQRGGVSDYVWSLSEGLASAGDTVHVWCPAVCTSTTVGVPDGVQLHRSFGRFTRADLRRVGWELDRCPAQRRLLVQWVPHSFGMRSLNVAFCLWLLKRSRHDGDRVEIMVHEPYLPFGRHGLLHNLAAAVHRVMAMVLLRAADRVWVSTPAWSRRWGRYTLKRKVLFAWIPIPSSISVVDDPDGVESVRARYTAAGQPLVGHFGTYRPAVASLLNPILKTSLETSDCVILLMGRGGEEFRDALLRRAPHLADRVFATGGSDVPDLSRCIQACDVMIQPYPDGVNGRQSSMAALLAHGRAAVTTAGASTEEIWVESGAVELVPVGDSAAAVGALISLLNDRDSRERIEEAAMELYRTCFDLSHVVSALRAGG